MMQKRILSIQDISCLGRCSQTVALPILSAFGHETAILPTAILSTHTGGFGVPVVTHLTEQAERTADHWLNEGVRFDGIVTGYLGSLEAIELVKRISGMLLNEEGLLIVDPAMADHGKMYAGLPDGYADAMKSLCRQADIILPNVTEASILFDTTVDNNDFESYVNLMNQRTPKQDVVLTGIEDGRDTMVIAVCEGERAEAVRHERLQGSYHGTGDIFTASFAGALLSGYNMVNSAEIAGNFTLQAIKKTDPDAPRRYGVSFERALPELIRNLNN